MSKQRKSFVDFLKGNFYSGLAVDFGEILGTKWLVLIISIDEGPL